MFTPIERRRRTELNQIRGYGYLYTFGLVEEFILPFILDHVRAHLNGDDCRTRALLHFAGEEAKQIQLFKTFAAEFKQGAVGSGIMIQDSLCALLETNPVGDSCALVPLATARGSVPTVAR
jgi:hypothetical protein